MTNDFNVTDEYQLSQVLRADTSHEKIGFHEICFAHFHIENILHVADINVFQCKIWFILSCLCDSLNLIIEYMKLWRNKITAKVLFEWKTINYVFDFSIFN